MVFWKVYTMMHGQKNIRILNYVCQIYYEGDLLSEPQCPRNAVRMPHSRSITHNQWRRLSSEEKNQTKNCDLGIRGTSKKELRASSHKNVDVQAVNKTAAKIGSKNNGFKVLPYIGESYFAVTEFTVAQLCYNQRNCPVMISSSTFYWRTVVQNFNRKIWVEGNSGVNGLQCWVVFFSEAVTFSSFG